jgi:hypothetical protein
MPYVRRDSAGDIVAMSEGAGGGCDEQVLPNDVDLQLFLARFEPSRDALAGTDQSFIRVLEDLIELLIVRGVIRFTDLPSAAQVKMMQRQQMREALRPHVDLLDHDTEDPLI